MNVRRILIWIAPILLLGMGTGCSSDNVRSKVYVWEMNNGEAVTSDVLHLGNDGVPSADDFIFEDEVPVTLWSTTRDDVVNTDAAYSFVTVERYTVRFESSEEIEGFSSGLGWLIPTRNTFEGFLTVVPADLKTKAPLLALRSGGEITATAHITFYARESDSDNELVFETSVPVHFANWSDER